MHASLTHVMSPETELTIYSLAETYPFFQARITGQGQAQLRVIFFVFFKFFFISAKVVDFRFCSLACKKYIY